MKLLVLLFLAAIIYSLGSGLYYLNQDSEKRSRLAKALTWRIALSAALFGFLVLGAYMGWIEPHPITPR